MKRNSHAPRIALLVDNPFRDLPGLVLVARHLAQQGAWCFLVPMNLRKAELWPLMPDFVLLNHLRTVYRNDVEDLTAAHIRVGALETEGGVYSPAASAVAGETARLNQDLEEFALSILQEQHLRQRVTPFCAWSERFAAHATRAGWFSAEQLVVTGVPRMDFYAAPWKAASLKLVPEAVAYAHDLVLINSSFNLANAAFNSPEAEVKVLCEALAYPRDYGDRLLAAQRQGLAGLTALVNQLAAAFPQATFVYRPHPFEGEAVYKELLKPLPNLHCVRRGTVDGWLLRAKALIHLGSSTAIDAALAGIPAFRPDWLPTFPPIPAVEAVSQRCANEADLNAQLAAVLAGTFTLPGTVQDAIAGVVSGTFHRVDGAAHKRVGDAVMAALKKGGRRSPSRYQCWRRTPKAPVRSLAGRVLRRIDARMGLEQRGFTYEKSLQRTQAWDTGSKRFDAQQVRRIADAVEAAATAAGESACPLTIEDAQAHDSYHFAYKSGRAVVVYAAS